MDKKGTGRFQRPVFTVIARKSGSLNKLNAGGFSLSKSGLSNLSDTGFVLTWLSDLNLLSDEIALKSFVFFNNRQNSDGSWNEVEYDDLLKVPEWKESGNIRSVLYQSANTMFWLYKFYNKAGCIDKGMKFLEMNYSKENTYLHTKWLFISLLSKKYSWESKNTKNLVNEIIKDIPENIPSSAITWMLWSFSVYGIPKGIENIIRIIKRIPQDKDGGISSEDGETYRVNATIERIKVLKYYGV